MDLGDRMAHAQEISTLAAGVDSLAAAIAEWWLSEEYQVYFLLGLVDELDLSAILIPSQAKDSRGEKVLAPRV